MLRACRASRGLETGGVLVGRYTADGHLAVVERASGRVEGSSSGRSWLVRGVKGLHEWLSRLWSSGRGHYVGEWHFHPFAVPTPSRQDVKQMRLIAGSDDYQCRDPLLVIVGGDPGAETSLHVEVNTLGGQRYVLEPLGAERGGWACPGRGP